MALGRYIKINDEVMPNPTAFSYDNPPDESVFTSESGKRMTQIRRLDRFTFSASFDCSSRLRDKLEALCQAPSVTVYMDGSETGIPGTLRKSGATSLVEGSERTTGTQGLWTVPVVFEGD